MHLGIFGLGVLGLYLLDFFGSVVPRPGPVPGVMGGGLRGGVPWTHTIFPIQSRVPFSVNMHFWEKGDYTRQ